MLGGCEAIRLALRSECFSRRLVRRSPLSKDTIEIKRRLVFHDIVCSLAPFGGQGFSGQSAVSFRFLSIIELSGLRAMANCMVDDFDKGP